MRAALAAVASLMLGLLTFYAQGLLPHALASFANSASGWTLLTVLLVVWSRLHPRWAAVLGAVSFVLLVLGYTVGARTRGLTYDPLLFSLVGVVAGPFVGLAASWLREAGVRAALGTALLAGIGIGEAIYGLTVIAASTATTYWVVIGLVGVALLTGMLARRIRGARPVAVAAGGATVVAAMFPIAYLALTVVPIG